MYGQTKRDAKTGVRPKMLDRILDRCKQWEDSPIGWMFCCELLLPLALVLFLLAFLADVSVTTAEKVRIVSPSSFAIYRGSRKGVRAAVAISYGLFALSALCVGGCLTVLMAGIELDPDCAHIPGMLLGLSVVTAVICAFTNVRLRRYTASMDTALPLNNTTAKTLPADETLLRGSAHFHPGSTDSLPRPFVQSVSNEPEGQLLRASANPRDCK